MLEQVYVRLYIKSFNLIQSLVVVSHPRSRQWIIVEDSHHFSLYMSDENGTNCSLSLENIVVQLNSSTGFTMDLKVVSNSNN